MNFSQLIQFNSAKKSANYQKLFYTLKLTLELKKSLINKVANDGLSINYQHVREI